jgi:integrase
MFMIGINTGLRVSDILKLKVSYFRNTDHLKIIEKKTGKEKRLLINPALKRELKKYMSKMADHEYLIQSRRGENMPLSRVTAYKILRAAAKKCNIKEIGTHTMRKTFGYFHYQQNKNIAVLMNIFNHSSEALTLRYIGVNQDLQDKTMRNFGL